MDDEHLAARVFDLIERIKRIAPTGSVGTAAELQRNIEEETFAVLIAAQDEAWVEAMSELGGQLRCHDKD